MGHPDLSAIKIEQSPLLSTWGVRKIHMRGRKQCDIPKNRCKENGKSLGSSLARPRDSCGHISHKISQGGGIPRFNKTLRAGKRRRKASVMVDQKSELL